MLLKSVSIPPEISPEFCVIRQSRIVGELDTLSMPSPVIISTNSTPARIGITPRNGYPIQNGRVIEPIAIIVHDVVAVIADRANIARQRCRGWDSCASRIISFCTRSPSKAPQYTHPVLKRESRRAGIRQSRSAGFVGPPRNSNLIARNRCVDHGCKSPDALFLEAPVPEAPALT